MIRYIFILSFLISGLLFSGAHAQDAAKYERIKAGKQFLSSSFLADWERHIREAPFVCGKTSFYSSRLGFGLNSETWFDGPYRLSRNYREDKSLDDVIIENPKYTAFIDLTKGTPNVIWYVPVADIPGDLVPDSFLVFSSRIHNNYRTYIFDLMKTGKLRIDDYKHQDNYHFVKLIPETEIEQIEYIRLRFDERYPFLPDTRITKREGRRAELAMDREFVEIGGFWIPTRFFGRDLAEGEEESYEFPRERTSFVKIEPDDKLDQTQCYLEYYGLPEPEIGPVAAVADFGRKSNRLVWIASAVGAISLLGLIFILWLRGKHNA